MSNLSLSFDIFCDVIDNYGDAGVCLHLARELVSYYSLEKSNNRDYIISKVRLFCNDMNVLATLLTKYDYQNHCLEFIDWQSPLKTYTPASVVISAFNCRFDEYTLKILQQAHKSITPPLIINLEYLSAEDWVESSHKLVSFIDNLEVHYFFPGFTNKTGGLNISNSFKQHALEILSENVKRIEGHHDTTGIEQLSNLKADWSNNIDVSVFTYQNPTLRHVFFKNLQTINAGSKTNTKDFERLTDSNKDQIQLNLKVFEGLPLDNINTILGTALKVGDSLSLGGISIKALAMVPHNEYDEILLTSDLNLVRGEDSIVRAMHVGKPFLWQIYVQDEKAHIEKIKAFLYRAKKILCEEYADFVQKSKLAQKLYIPLNQHDLLNKFNLFEQVLLSYNSEGDFKEDFSITKYMKETMPIYHNLALYLCLQESLASRILEFAIEKLSSINKD